MYFGVSAPFSSMSLFAPTIVSGLGYTSLQAQLMTVPPYAASWVVSIIVGFAADKLNRRGLFAGVFAVVGAVGFIASATLPPEAFAVSTDLHSYILCTVKLNIHTASIRNAYYRVHRHLFLHSSAPRMAIQQHALDVSYRTCSCIEHFLRCPRANRRSFHLQVY